MPRTHAALLATTFILNLALVDSSLADQWDGQFGLRGFSQPTGTITDLWVSGTNLYAIGNFPISGNLASQDIARWDGVAWSGVGELLFPPPQSELYAIVEHQGSLVVAGNFDEVNGQTGDLAVWDGATWTAVHSPLLFEKNIIALASDGTNLYLGLLEPDFVIRYNGTTFEPLVTSATFNCCAAGVWDLLWWNDLLYAVGLFKSLNGVTLNNVGYWDGVQWVAMGTGTTVFPKVVFAHNDEIYLSGQNVYEINITKWTGTQWVDAVTDNAVCQFGGGVLDALFFRGELYRSSVGGTTSPVGTPVFGVTKWTGSEWDDMDGGVASCAGSPLVEYDGRLVVNGYTAGGMPSPGLALWEGEHWYANAPDEPVRVIATSGTDVYLAGDFEVVLETPAHHIARWDGSSWNALGSGVDGIVHDMVMIESDLYVAGDFTDAGGTGARNVAKWDGANWSAIGTTTTLFGVVHALATDGVNLYAGGDFTIVANPFALRVAKWDGTSWSALGGGVTNGSVEALEWYDGNLYVGGNFTTTENSLMGNPVRWNGTAWASMAGGLGGTVRDFEVHAGMLYAGGDFTHTAGTIVNHVAVWNGTAWGALNTYIPKGVDGPVRAMASIGGSLYLAGDFTSAGGEAASHIVRWDGTGWNALGSGVNRPAYALAVGADAVFVGGEFTQAGGFGSRCFARWMLSPTAVVQTSTASNGLGPAFPNPFNPETRIRYRVAEAGRVTIAVYDVNGRRVQTLVDETHPGSPNERTVTWEGNAHDGSRAASGVYFVRMTAPGFEQTQKIVLLK